MGYGRKTSSGLGCGRGGRDQGLSRHGRCGRLEDVLAMDPLDLASGIADHDRSGEISRGVP